jgi:Fe2+ or Zn2+ uptake regulation protein
VGETASITQQCRARRVLLTPKRLQMIERLETREGSFDAEGLHGDLIARGVKVSRTMVYRTLRQLADEGVLLSLGYREGRQLFSRPSGRALRVIDAASGASFDIEDPDLRGRIAAAAAGLGLQIDGHDVDLILRAPAERPAP